MKQLYSSSSEAEARELRQFILANGTEATVAPKLPDEKPKSTTAESWIIVVHDDDLEDGMLLLAQFLQRPAVALADSNKTSTGKTIAPRSTAWLVAQMAVVLVLTQAFYSPIDELLWSFVSAETWPTFWVIWTIDMLQVLLPAAFVFLAIWIGRERVANYGLKPLSISIDIVTGFLAFACAVVASVIGSDSMRGLLTDLSGELYEKPRLYEYWLEAPHNVAGLLALLAISVAIAFEEELIMRGYLITTLEKLTKSSPISLGLAAAYFGICHSYGGPVHIWSTFLVGLVFGTFFVWTRRLWPLIFAHAFFDFALFILPPPK